METPQRSELEKKTVHGCAPVCSSTRCHEPGEARTDLGLKKPFSAGTIRWLSSCEWSFSSLPTDASARVVLTDGRDDIVVLNPHWLVSIFHPPPPLKFCLTKAAATSWQSVQTVKGRSHMFHGWAKSGWVCDRTFLGVFRASLLWCVWTGALLIEFDFMFFNRFKFKLWLQNRCRCNCTNRFFSSSSSPTLQ